MATVIRVQATVLPGGKVEVTDPALPAGRPVDAVVTVGDPTPAGPPVSGVYDWLMSRPPATRTPEEWAEREREIQEEKDSWERPWFNDPPSTRDRPE